MRQLTQTAALAATTGDGQAVEIIRLALRDGDRAAARGQRLPLFPLLDLTMVLDSRNGFSELCGRLGSSQQCECQLRYDDWLAELARLSRRWLIARRAGDDDRDSRRHHGRPDCLDVVLAACPSGAVQHNGLLVDWRVAYQRLRANDRAIHEILGAWRAERSSDSGLWAKWWPTEADDRFTDSGAVRIGAVRSSFATETEAVSALDLHHNAALVSALDLRLDPAAVHAFLNADNPTLLPDQARRIQRLRCYQHDPTQLIPDTPAEQHPLLGAVPLSAQVYEPFEVLQSRLANHEDPRLTDPPCPNPNRSVHVHLCWWHSYAEAASVWPYPKEPKRKPTTADGKASHAAVLKAVAALLLEDWRAALVDLPVCFYLHRGWTDGVCAAPADPARIVVGLPGQRWRDAGHGTGLPGFGVVRMLFGRHTAVQLARGGGTTAWTFERGEELSGVHWFCLLALQPDVQALTNADLPPCFTHVIVVEAPTGKAQLRVRRPDARKVEFDPLSMRQGLDAAEDWSFIALRVCSIDLLLEVMEAKLR